MKHEHLEPNKLTNASPALSCFCPPSRLQLRLHNRTRPNRRLEDLHQLQPRRLKNHLEAIFRALLPRTQQHAHVHDRGRQIRLA